MPGCMTSSLELSVFFVKYNFCLSPKYAFEPLKMKLLQFRLNLILNQFKYSFQVPAHVPITDSLREKLDWLVTLNVRLSKIRERVQFYQNVTSFAQLGGHVHQHPEEYRLYVAKLGLLQHLTNTMWIIQDEIDDLQSKILAEIYGQGGDTH